MKYMERFIENVKKYGQKASIIDNEGRRSTSYEKLDMMSGKIAEKLKLYQNKDHNLRREITTI